ncbi:MAG TPA: cytochrome C [Planctomycetes bacterium]|nr:cytochrome C [Planctomycetota bacterium]
MNSKRLSTYALAGAVLTLAVPTRFSAPAYPDTSAPAPGPEALAIGDSCVDCHARITPGIVEDWKVSRHATEKVSCHDCHGAGHDSMSDPEKARTVTPGTCQSCHEEQYAQFARSKHAYAWASFKAMPTTHWKPMELIDGMKGCGGCHKIGLKTDEEIEHLKEIGSGYGLASCDSCHTRHTFSVKEASEPEACASCHMGFDHPQWEMWKTSKHGVRHTLKRQGVLPETASAPTCQTCHMEGGNHEVMTAWGFLAVRTDGLAPYPGEDPDWWADRVTILQALGVLDPEGKPTARLDVVAGAEVARLTKASWDEQRARMVKACTECHSSKFAEGELAKGDQMIRHVDKLLAEAIRVVAGLYEDGILEKPDNYAYPFPDLLTFHDSPTPIENRLFNMHLKHRMRAFQGTFHANADYALWYGWSEMVQDLTEIKAMAEELRRNHGG